MGILTDAERRRRSIRITLGMLRRCEEREPDPATRELIRSLELVSLGASR